jgi:hypothetical protein
MGRAATSKWARRRARFESATTIGDRTKFRALFGWNRRLWRKYTASR